MKKTIYVALMTISLATVFNACKTKKDDPKPAETGTPPAKASITPLLINKPWKMEKYVISPVITYEMNGQILSASDFFLPGSQTSFWCVTDDIYVFKAAETTAVSGIYTKSIFESCNTEKDQNGTWVFNSDQTQIIMTAGDGSITIFNIAKITATTLDVTYSNKNPLRTSDTKEYTSTVTFVPYTAVASKANLLINKKWIMNACVISPAMELPYLGQTFSVSNLFDPLVQSVSQGCATDDEFEFKATGSAALSGEFYRKANNKCTDGELDQTGTWEFNRDQTQIYTYTNGNRGTIFNIVELTPTKLKVEFSTMNPIDNNDIKSYTASTTLEPK